MMRAGRFLWLNWAQGRTRAHVVNAEREYFEGEHDGYRSLRVTHRRGVLRVHNVWIVTDDILGDGNHATRLHWLMPDFPYLLSETARRLTMNTPAGDFTIQVWCDHIAGLSLVRAGSPLDKTRGWRSVYYAEKMPALSMALDTRAELPVRFITVLGPSDSVARRIEADRVMLEIECGEFSIDLNAPDRELIVKA